MAGRALIIVSLPGRDSILDIGSDISYIEAMSRYKTRSQIIHETLRREILLGSLELGRQLRQDEIAQRFEVSRIPVREALKSLAAEGLVELRPHQKAVVRKYSAVEIEDIFLIRSLLEPKAGAMACTRLRDADLGSLRTLLQQMSEVGNPPDFVRYLELNREFHMTIYRASGSQALSQLLEHFIDQSARFIHLYLRATDTLAKAAIEHEEIYRACQQREPDILERVILDHVRQTVALLNESAFQSLKA
jgi:DNA-binding GntR family transcriptional regulator